MSTILDKELKMHRAGIDYQDIARISNMLRDTSQNIVRYYVRGSNFKLIGVIKVHTVLKSGDRSRLDVEAEAVKQFEELQSRTKENLTLCFE